MALPAMVKGSDESAYREKAKYKSYALDIFYMKDVTALLKCILIRFRHSEQTGIAS